MTGPAEKHWQEAWLYKWIECAACLHRLSADAWLESRVGRIRDALLTGKTVDAAR